jgi:hypothetical protein
VVPLLGERVLRRWSAVIVGFVVSDRASASTATLLSPPSLIAFAGSIMFAFLMITTRTLRGTPDIVLVTWQTAAALVFGLAVAPFQWVEPSAEDYGPARRPRHRRRDRPFLREPRLKLAPRRSWSPIEIPKSFGWCCSATRSSAMSRTRRTVIGSAIIVGRGSISSCASTTPPRRRGTSTALEHASKSGTGFPKSM